jgi:NAD(P)-dependent dehydrogenase (short-subunit alcohol dehydrogenase family)
MRSKVLLLTGATGGLGPTVVRHLTGRGYRCLVAYRSRDRFDDLCAAIGAGELVQGVPADPTDPESVENAAAVMPDHGIPWGLVHLAGAFVAAPATETALETWDHMMDVNLRSAFIALRAVARQLRNGPGGRLVFVGSTAVLDLPAGMAAYAVAKAAVTTLAGVAAKELSGTGITVNAVLPDAIETKAMREAGLGIPLVPPDRIAATIGWLVSDESAAVTGALVPIRAEA